ncbi:MAG: N-6 DNA methylase [Pseudohongiella sp.]|nr:N-6 DNA methylase [Pseudohongiella sp.]
MRNHRKEFISHIKRFHGHQTWRVFTDFCEITACSISNSVSIGALWEKREAQYMEAIKRYNKTELTLFAQLLAIVVDALTDEMQDFLGGVFMELELGNHWRGQFFTPYHMGRMMAELTYGTDLPDAFKATDFITLSDPACGAGCMVVAFAETMLSKKINYQQHMHATCIDIDETAAFMAYIQLSLLHVPATILIGNTLSMEIRDTYYTPAHVLGGWTFRLAARHVGQNADQVAVQKTVVERPTPPALTGSRVSHQNMQICLFD